MIEPDLRGTPGPVTNSRVRPNEAGNSTTMSLPGWIAGHSREGTLLAPSTSISDSFRSAALTGWLVIALFFGVLGGWAVMAPMHGAVIANGVVKVEGNRKSMQHLDGGIIRELFVADGDRVYSGELIAILDKNQARAEYDVLFQQYLVLRATEERLKAEAAQLPSLSMPNDLAYLAEEQPLKAIWSGQQNQFESRMVALAGQRNVVRERIAQIQAQIQGAEAQVRAFRAQFDSIQKELEALSPLVEKGLIARPRFLSLERTGIGLEGQIADTLASIAKLRQAIAEQSQQFAQLNNDRMTEVTKELRDTQARLLEVIPRMTNAEAVLERTEIRAPYSGRVVNLNVFSIGGVINRGEKILDIVPDENSLIIETQIAVEDISDVHLNARADVHLTAYKQRITPIVRGEVIQVSADRLVDNKSGAPYFLAQIRIDEKDLKDVPDVKLYPGMPATVMIPTIQRTALDYLIGPLAMSFNKSFRQK